MPFSYDYRPSPFIGQLSDLMLRSGDIRARAAEAVAAANARAVEQSGAAWADAATNIGHEVAALPGQIQAQRQSVMKQQLEQQQLAAGTQNLAAGKFALDEKQKAVAERDIFAKTLTETPLLDQGGSKVFDLPVITQKLSTRGIDPSVYIKPLSELNDTFHNFNTGRLAVVTQGAEKVAAAGNDPTLAGHFLDAVEANKVYPPEQIQQFRDLIEKEGTQGVAKITSYLMGPQKPVIIPRGGTAINPVTNQPVATGAPMPPTEPELALKASGGDATLAMHMLKPDANLKPGTVEDWVGRARRLAVTANNGQPLSDAQQQAVDTKAMQQFKETNADPELRAAALAQKNIAASLVRMQMDQVPTKEQAASVADDLVHHRIAPEQLASLFSTRGKEGLAFKLNVTAEAKKIDPSFNFEEASATYNLTKSQGFQNTVRYMDSALESIPRLEQNAKNLGNGDFRTLNQLANAGKNQFNSTDLKRFKTDALLVGDEVAKILSGGGTGSATSDAKLKQATDIIGQSDSVPAIAAAMEEVQALMGNRRRALTRGTYMEGTSAVKTDGTQQSPMPDLAGLTAGRGRTFSDGPYKGQTWTVGPDGKPRKVQ